jgi:hypothetical protein
MTLQLQPPPTVMPRLISGGFEIDPTTVGDMVDSSNLRDQPEALNDRLDADGYLFLRNALPVDRVLAAREAVCAQLAHGGYLDASAPANEAMPDPQRHVSFKPEYANGNPEIQRLLYGPEMLDIFRGMFAADVSHYDFTWLRAVSPGAGTPSHCDVVYMGRGETQRLRTVWTPLGDVSFALGGLIVLEGSHKHERLRQTYGQHDVDTYCTNKPEKDGWRTSLKDGVADEVGWRMGGSLDNDLNRIRAKLGVPGKWRTSEYAPGDVVIFTTYTVHASLDNTSDRIRLSTDSRYQPAGTILDERWIGPNPIAHDRGRRKGMIC